MFLKKHFNFRYTLAFRLTLWYAGIFAVSSSVAFLFFYLLIASVIRDGTDQDLLSRAKQLSSHLNIDGIEAVRRVAVLEAQAAGEKKIFVRLLYPNGTAFSSSNMSYWKDITISRNSINRIIGGSGHVFETISIPHRKHNVRVLYGVIGPGILLQLGQSTENQSRFIEAFQKMFITTMSILILSAALIGWFMARRAITGVEAVTKTARHISEGSLDQRVPVNERGDEIDQLALTFNHMLDRIQALVINIKEISDNIAHDLRSPITRIRGLAEVTITTGNTLAEYETMAANTIEECDRLLDMINTMLVISKTEAGVEKIKRDPMDMASLIHDACELFEPMAEDKGIQLTCNIPDQWALTGDVPMVQRMIANVIDNAIKYTPSGGEVTLSARTTRNGSINILIKDTGVGISQEDLPHIFKRFYRCDQSRSRPGTGLGLSLARAIAKAHGGDITAASTLNVGSTFSIILPITDTTAFEQAIEIKDNKQRDRTKTN